MVSKAVGAMLDICDAGSLPPAAAITATPPVASLNACLLVQRANEAVAEASAAATTQPLVAFTRQLLTYCEANPEDTRAAKHLQGFWEQG